MAEHRAHPPSPRRRALARQAGLHAASPILVGAGTAAAAIAAVAMLGGTLVHRLGEDIARACASASAPSRLLPPDATGPLAPASIVEAVLSVALPILGVAAVAALVAHLAQTRAGWLPRRRIDNAPSLPGGGGARVRRTVLDLIAAVAIAVTAFGWLWWAAPRIATLPTIPMAAGALVISGLAALVIAWSVIGAGDALLRHAALANALHMTAREKREDDRSSTADPRWRALQRKLSRSEVSADALAGATVLILGDGLAIAIAWDPIRRPIPHRIASGSDVRATQLLGLARRFGVPVHREPDLARAIAGTGPVAEDYWPRLAEIVAAVRR